MSAFKPPQEHAVSRFIGILAIFMAGIVICAHPYPGIYADVSDDFMKWQNAIGIIMIIHSVILFVAYVLRKANEKESVAISIVFTAIYAIMVYRLFNAPEIVPVLSYDKDKLRLLEDSEFKDSAVRIVLGSMMALMAFTIGHSLLTIVKDQRGRG